MRIGFVVSGVLDERSGGFLYDSRFVEFLRKQGDEVVVISLPEMSYRDAKKAGHRGRTLGLLLEARCDLLIEDELCHPYLSYIHRQPGYDALPARIALVHHLRCDENHAWYKKAFSYRPRERRYLQNVAAFIWNGQDTMESVLRMIRQSETKGVIARPWIGADYPVKAPDGAQLREAFTRMIFVGNIMKRKNLHIIVKALVRLGKNAPALTIIGSEDFEPAYVRRCKRIARRAAAGISFMGRVTAQALPEIYQRHQVLVLPSSHEGYGIVYLEAMRLGLAVVGSKVGGAPQAIGGGGVLVSPGKIGELAQAIFKLQNDDEFRYATRVRALGHAEAHPRWEEGFTAARDLLAGLVVPVTGNPVQAG